MSSAPRVALITGAGSPTGIGFATAMALGGAGLRVVVAGLGPRVQDRARDLRAAGMDATAFVGDLKQPESVAHLAADAGPIDVLVNNAGMASAGVIDEQLPVTAMPLELWQRAMDRNLTSAFLVTRGTLPAMIRRGYGRIVNISSTTGAVAGVAHQPAHRARRRESVLAVVFRDGNRQDGGRFRVAR